jgi:hypothetical protein
MMAWIIAEAALAVQPRATAIEGLYFGLGAAIVGLACSLDELVGYPFDCHLASAQVPDQHRWLPGVGRRVREWQ